MREIHLHDVHQTTFDEASNVFHHVRAFAGGDRQVRGVANGAISHRVLGRCRLFDPLGIERFECLATAAAVDGVNRPCISSMSCTSGPTASRTAPTMAMAWRRSAAESSALAWPNGSSFSPR